MIKLISLNIENDTHIERVRSFFKEQQADIILVQELYRRYIPQFEQELAMNSVFAPLCLKSVDDISGKTEEWGIAIFSRQKILKQYKLYYVGNENKLQLFDRATQDQTRYKALLGAEIEKDRQKYLVFTTHFTASPQIAVSEQQRKDLHSLQSMLSLFPEVILAGDFNSERGQPVFDALSQRYKDNIPAAITSTFDKTLHRHPEWESVVDGLFTTPEYHVTTIKFESGVSDHLAIIAEIERKEAHVIN